MYTNGSEQRDDRIRGRLPSTFQRASLVQENYRNVALSSSSKLIDGYGDQVVKELQPSQRFPNEGVYNKLILKSNFPAPLDSLGLLITTNKFDLGFSWLLTMTLVGAISLVLLAGLFGLYRLGLSQIELASQQSNFVSAVGHELKTPLTSIRMYSEMLKDGYADADKQKEYFHFIFSESERLSRLIQNVLRLAKMRNQNELDDLNFENMKGKTLLDEVVSKVQGTVEDKNFSLNRIEEGDVDELIRVDRDAFTQIFINVNNQK